MAITFVIIQLVLTKLFQKYAFHKANLELVISNHHSHFFVYVLIYGLSAARILLLARLSKVLNFLIAVYSNYHSGYRILYASK